MSDFKPTFLDYKLLLGQLGFNYAQRSLVTIYDRKCEIDGKDFFGNLESIKTRIYQKQFNLTQKIIKQHINSTQDKPKSSRLEDWKEKHQRFKGGSIGLTEYSYSKVLAIDIDYHFDFSNLSFADRQEIKKQNLKSSQKVISFLNKVFETEPILIEHSRFGQGSHIYYRFNICITDELKELVKDYIFEKTQIKLEFRSERHSLRIPFAKDYCRASQRQKRIQEYQKRYDTISKAILSKSVEILKSKLSEIQTKKEIIPLVIHVRENNEKRFIKYEEFCQRNYRIESGRRREVTLKMAFAALRYGVDKERFIQTVLSQKGTSKDLNSWSNPTARKYLSQMYRWCQANYSEERYDSLKQDFVKTNKDQFHSNKHLLSKRQLKSVKLLTLRIHRSNLPKYKGHYQRQKQDLEMFLQEFFSQFLYDYKNQKIIGLQGILTNEKRELLRTSTSFSDVWLNRLKEYYGIKSDIKRLLRICIFYLQSNNLINLTLKGIYFIGLSYCNQYQLNLFRFTNLLFNGILKHNTLSYLYLVRMFEDWSREIRGTVRDFKQFFGLEVRERWKQPILE